MSTIKNILSNPKTLLIIGAAFLGISFIDVLAVTDASAISEMTWWGQASVWAFMGMLAIMALRFAILPIVGSIGRLFKKK